MRAGLIFATLLIAGCAHERLALAPPAGVDLSGHWRLNAADSDDAQHLVAILGSADESPAGGDGDADGSAQAGRQRVSAAPPVPVHASVGEIAEAMRWPGKDLLIEQTGGVVAFSSGGESRVYRPWSPLRGKAPRGRDARPVCGWSGRALLVTVAPDGDGPMIDLRYRLSADRQRLFEQVSQGSGPGGVELFRVWDRAR
ncbi:MAG TPA: hypothetical protein VND80_02825 [Steroidobacteraceae bacterium]|nr:hypothetical protein [Steroidobacteraceae bacterium]